MANEIRIRLKDALGNYYYPMVTPECLTELLTIAAGGTGASTAEGARTNLGVYSTDETYTKTEVDEKINDVEAGETTDVKEIKARLDTAEENIITIQTNYATIEYVNEEIASHISEVLVFKGVKETLAELEALTDMSVGDAWIVHEKDALYVYDGDAWHSAGELVDVDLSDYVTLEDFNALVTRVSTAEGKITTIEGEISSLTEEVASKADTSALETVSDKVDTLESDLEGKADESEITDLSKSIEDLTTTVNGKADTSTVNEISSSVTTLQSSVSSLETTVASKADASTVAEIESTLESLTGEVLYFELVDE